MNIINSNNPTHKIGLSGAWESQSSPYHVQIDPYGSMEPTSGPAKNKQNNIPKVYVECESFPIVITNPRSNTGLLKRSLKKKEEWGSHTVEAPWAAGYSCVVASGI